jgi:uncharacterized membrane protein YtjA (UPF0391 family)
MPGSQSLSTGLQAVAMKSITPKVTGMAQFEHSLTHLTKGKKVMLSYAITFLIIAIIAGVLGFIGIAGLAAEIAKILFVVFLILFIISLVAGRRPPV